MLIRKYNKNENKFDFKKVKQLSLTEKIWSFIYKKLWEMSLYCT